MNMMLTIQSQANEVVAPNDNEDDDIGVLIYREFQLRKAEAAAAAERKTKSTASTRRTSSRKRLPINMMRVVKNQYYLVHNATVLQRQQANESNHWMKMGPEKIWPKRKERALLLINQVIQGGVCTRHGAKVKRCSSKGCTNKAVKGGVCVKHGAKVKRCNKEGCTNQAIQGGVCVRHGAKVKR
mmetsp:Transcript_14646/g.30044  ORF Transcript_14646/g.30044 Transcript_14646/m.30044 type:complete len:184 (+) Transcript_14646:162-713(+)